MAEPRSKSDETLAGPSVAHGEARLPLRVVERDALAPVPARRLRRAARVLRMLAGAMLLVAAGGLIGLYFQPLGLQALMNALSLAPGGGTSRPMTAPAPEATGATGAGAAAARRGVIGLGKLAPAGEVATIAAPYGAGDARVARLEVEEGDAVAAGAVLAVLDNERPLRAALAAAEATIAAREAELAQTRASVLASRAEAGAALARAEAVARNAGRELDRARSLRDQGVTADATFDERESALDQAQRAVEEARAFLSRYGAGDVEQQEDVQVAQRALGSARAERDRAEADLDAAFVRAPTAATVLDIHVRAGERPSDAGILDLADLATMKATVEVYQTQIAAVAPGDPVEITAEALPGPLHGVVRRIGLEVGRQSLVDAGPAANTDARVVEVTVALGPASSEIARAFTGLEVLARIDPGPRP